MKISMDTKMRWRVIKGDAYVDIRDMQLALRSVECENEDAKTAFEMMAEALQDFEDSLLEE